MNGMQSYCQGDGREKLFEMIAELERQVAQGDGKEKRIAELERQVAQMQALMKEQHSHILDLRAELARQEYFNRSK